MERQVRGVVTQIQVRALTPKERERKQHVVANVALHCVGGLYFVTRVSFSVRFSVGIFVTTFLHASSMQEKELLAIYRTSASRMSKLIYKKG